MGAFSRVACWRMRHWVHGLLLCMGSQAYRRHESQASNGKCLVKVKCNTLMHQAITQHVTAVPLASWTKQMNNHNFIILCVVSKQNEKSYQSRKSVNIVCSCVLQLSQHWLSWLIDQPSSVHSNSKFWKFVHSNTLLQLLQLLQASKL